MTNPLYDAKQGNPYGALIQQAKELQRTLQGNPRDIVQQLLNSGQMSQAQFNQLSQQAQAIMPFIN